MLTNGVSPSCDSTGGEGVAPLASYLSTQKPCVPSAGDAGTGIMPVGQVAGPNAPAKTVPSVKIFPVPESPDGFVGQAPPAQTNKLLSGKRVLPPEVKRERSPAASVCSCA